MAIADQTLMTPVLTAALLVYLGLVVQRREAHEFRRYFDQKYFRLLKSGYCFWPFFQFANFFLVPLHLRIYAVNVAGLLWSIFLCTFVNRE